MSTFVDVIEAGFAKDCQTKAVFLDIKAAFDNASHPAILHQLIKRECPTYLIHLLKSFLIDGMVEIHYKNCSCLPSYGIWSLIVDFDVISQKELKFLRLLTTLHCLLRGKI